MEKKSRTKKREHDLAVTAFRVVQEATKEPEEVQPESRQTVDGKNPHAVALGRLGGKKGGAARASKLTKAQRSEIAKKAALTRWHHKR